MTPEQLQLSLQNANNWIGTLSATDQAFMRQLITQESGGRHDLTSSAGAAGLGQIIPERWADISDWLKRGNIPPDQWPPGITPDNISSFTTMSQRPLANTFMTFANMQMNRQQALRDFNKKRPAGEQASSLLEAVGGDPRQEATVLAFGHKDGPARMKLFVGDGGGFSFDRALEFYEEKNARHQARIQQAIDAGDTARAERLGRQDAHGHAFGYADRLSTAVGAGNDLPPLEINTETAQRMVNLRLPNHTANNPAVSGFISRGASFDRSQTASAPSEPTASTPAAGSTPNPLDSNSFSAFLDQVFPSTAANGGIPTNPTGAAIQTPAPAATNSSVPALTDQGLADTDGDGIPDILLEGDTVAQGRFGPNVDRDDVGSELIGLANADQGTDPADIPGTPEFTARTQEIEQQAEADRVATEQLREGTQELNRFIRARGNANADVDPLEGVREILTGAVDFLRGDSEGQEPSINQRTSPAARARLEERIEQEEQESRIQNLLAGDPALNTQPELNDSVEITTDAPIAGTFENDAITWAEGAPIRDPSGVPYPDPHLQSVLGVDQSGNLDLSKTNELIKEYDSGRPTLQQYTEAKQEQLTREQFDKEFHQPFLDNIDAGINRRVSRGVEDILIDGFTPSQFDNSQALAQIAQFTPENPNGGTNLNNFAANALGLATDVPDNSTQILESFNELQELREGLDSGSFRNAAQREAASGLSRTLEAAGINPNAFEFNPLFDFDTNVARQDFDRATAEIAQGQQVVGQIDDRIGALTGIIDQFTRNPNPLFDIEANSQLLDQLIEISNLERGALDAQQRTRPRFITGGSG